MLSFIVVLAKTKSAAVAPSVMCFDASQQFTLFARQLLTSFSVSFSTVLPCGTRGSN